MRRLPVLLLLLLPIVACTSVRRTVGLETGRVYPVYFQPWSAQLDATAQRTVSVAAAQAKENPDLPVAVAGFADPTGSSQANVDMSRTRAQVVTDQLVADGVAPKRIRRTVHGATDYTLNSQETRRVDIAVGTP